MDTLIPGREYVILVPAGHQLAQEDIDRLKATFERNGAKVITFLVGAAGTPFQFVDVTIEPEANHLATLMGNDGAVYHATDDRAAGSFGHGDL